MASWVQANKSNFQEISAGWDADCTTTTRVLDIVKKSLDDVVKGWSVSCDKLAAKCKALLPPKATIENPAIMTTPDLQAAFMNTLSKIDVAAVLLSHYALSFF